jgi:hypothetical protein
MPSIGDRLARMTADPPGPTKPATGASDFGILFEPLLALVKVRGSLRSSHEPEHSRSRPGGQW